MIKHDEVLRALRTALLSLEFATTGVTTLGAIATGFTRTSGSFIADGFASGMEITPFGFASTTPLVISRVEDLRLTVDTPIATQAAAANRRLVAELPAVRGWVDWPIEPVVGRPYIEEDYLFGPSEQPGVGPYSTVIGEPVYVVRFYVPSGVGFLASAKYVGAMLRHFAPGKAMALASGGVVRVRTNPAPFAGQTLTRTDAPRWSQNPVTVPLRLSALNTI